MLHGFNRVAYVTVSPVFVVLDVHPFVSYHIGIVHEFEQKLLCLLSQDQVPHVLPDF